MIGIIKLISSILAGFITIIGSILAVVFSFGIIINRNASLLPLLLGSIGLIFTGLIIFKVFGYKIKKGLETALENLHWFV